MQILLNKLRMYQEDPISSIIEKFTVEDPKLLEKYMAIQFNRFLQQYV